MLYVEESVATDCPYFLSFRFDQPFFFFYCCLPRSARSLRSVRSVVPAMELDSDSELISWPSGTGLVPGVSVLPKFSLVCLAGVMDGGIPSPSRPHWRWLQANPDLLGGRSMGLLIDSSTLTLCTICTLCASVSRTIFLDFGFSIHLLEKLGYSLSLIHI